ncbi:MAG: hypothetical protein MUC46_00270 [Desulfobacterales bacterium]|jgi:hypothetical protein|nr:hypothetical protein [Desulfobacterales bacterium]
MSGRTLKILGRLPAHLDAARPEKQIFEVTDALARDLDAQSAAMAAIRRAHRLADADEERDVLLIAARHGLGLGDFALLLARLHRVGELLDALGDAADEEEMKVRAEALLDLWSVAAPPPRLVLFGDTTGAAVEAIREEVKAHLATKELLDGIRRRVAQAAVIHAGGNGTVRALMAGAANALDLDLGPVAHSEDRFWHAAEVWDRLRVGGLAPARELLGIEENPLFRFETDQAGRKDGELFSLLRRGFERAVLQVRVTGKESLTLGPMVVNRDEGHGVGYSGAVPAGGMLRFTEEGRVFLDGADVTASGYAWKGACFAGADHRDTDFVFDGPRSTFAVAYPEKALDPEFVFPHAGESLPMPGIAVGETRFAYFAHNAFFSGLRRVAPRPAVGFADLSVFAASAGEEPPVSALVSFSWLERRAFCVRVLIPPRFRALTPDDPEGLETRRRVAQSLVRVRPAGVEVTVEFVENRWELGKGALLSGEAEDPIAELRAGTTLWSAPTTENP